MSGASFEPSIEAAARHYRARDLVRTEGCCRAILALQPRDFDALHLLGVVCVQSGRHAEAVGHLTQALAQRVDHAQLLFNLGNAHQGLDQHDEAIRAYRRALALSPHDPGVLNNLGTSYRHAGRVDDAIHAFRTLLALHPNHAPAHNNLAAALVQDDRLEEALGHFQAALAMAPPDTPSDRLADVVNGLGKVLLDLGRPQEAVQVCRDLLSRYPALSSVEWNLSLALLLTGDYAEGWRTYEARWLQPDHDKPHPDAQVLDLATVTGQRVLVTAEQGRGDIIQFARYAALLANRGADVALSVYPDLVELMRSVRGVTTVVATEDPDPPYDQRTSLLSLPFAFGTDLTTVPAAVPYLRPPPERRMLWRERFSEHDRPRVGVVWSGSEESRARSAMPVERLQPLLSQPDIDFHVLQKDIPDQDRALLATYPRALCHDQRLGDFADTAALILEMDLVITIDTAVAHLAGALAVPVWIMLPFNPDWRWLIGREDTPWYPTARLFRQTRRGAWDSVVQRVAEALAKTRFPLQTP